MKSGGKKQKVHVVTMGCAKNVVDSERLAAQLRRSRIELTDRIEDADVAVINTCGFITPAKQESIDAIISHVKLKSMGRLKKVYAMGCLTERYAGELAKEIPEVDGFFGSHQIEDVVKTLGGRFKKELLGERILSTPPHTAFLKISEGCDRPCAFCAIPLMRGAHVSRPIEDLVHEATTLALGGVRELVVIAQDTTFYGLDLYGRRRLPELLERLADVRGIDWVRLMYAFPSQFPSDVLQVIARHPQICKYIDMPVQHSADVVLRAMRRGITGKQLRELLARIRETVPGVALRTTLITGFPGEGVAEFEDLLRFVEESKFARLGVFTYSQEEGTSAYGLGDPVPEEEKQRRHDAVMALQQEISAEANQALIGTHRKVLVDRVEEDVAVGRLESDAPEIDNEVFINGTPLPSAGEMVMVEIVDAYEYDVVGNLVTV
jgi:ribosomal protein S12 methylthiotransferase